jgi:hypothetical protein
VSLAALGLSTGLSAFLKRRELFVGREFLAGHSAVWEFTVRFNQVVCRHFPLPPPHAFFARGAIEIKKGSTRNISRLIKFSTKDEVADKEKIFWEKMEKADNTPFFFFRFCCRRIRIARSSGPNWPARSPKCTFLAFSVFVRGEK